jgi:hypothetical protein
MIIFKNKGLIDEKSITTFGVSSKENSSAIGYFGTGLKYAIAILLREGCEVKIHIGKKVLNFGVKEEKIRVNDFTIVTMNDTLLSFTTELGKNWKLWQAFRELYCNCTDENGEIYESNNAECAEDETMVCVAGGAFTNIYNNRDEIILSSPALLHLDGVNIHPNQSNFLFYKGVSVHKLDKPSLYTYNLTRADLTEDRTLKYYTYYLSGIANSICNSSNSEMLKNVLHADKYYAENDFNFEGNPSDECIDICLIAAKKFDLSLNKSARKLCRGWVQKALDENSNYELKPIDKMMLESAIKFCKFIGYNVTEFNIKVSENLGEGTLGRAHEDVIYLSTRVFMQGTKQVATTLLEEYLHLKFGLLDETYKMQTFLFDIIAGLGEQLQGEPI